MKPSQTRDLPRDMWSKSLTEDRKGREDILRCLTYPDNSVVEYGYTARNQVASIIAAGPPPLATFTYDPTGNRLTKTLENGVTATSIYDDANRLSSLTHAKGAVNLAALDYTYDLLNRRTKEQLDGNGGDNFSYDAIDQLVHIDYASGNTTGYTYDAAGNRTQVDDSASGLTNYAAANSLNQYSTFGASGTAAYDANGNLSGLNNGAQSWTFAYDSANRLIGNNGGSIVFTFRYDARNRVIKRLLDGVTTYQIYDGWNLIAEYSAAGNLLTKYIHGPNVDELLAKTDSNGSVYYHENALDSTMALTDASGNVVERYAYDVYGKPIFKDESGNGIPASAYGNRFLFTGREWLPKLSLYDYRNRFYSPELGRFLQTDPIRFDAEDVNLYRYVSNSITNLIDPDGLTGRSFECCDEKKIEEGRKTLDERYEKESAQMRSEGVKPGGKGNESCANVNSRIEEALQPTPDCWSCMLERRYKAPFGYIWRDHWIVRCTAYDQKGQKSDETVYDFWTSSQGKDRLRELEKEYPKVDEESSGAQVPKGCHGN